MGPPGCVCFVPEHRCSGSTGHVGRSLLSAAWSWGMAWGQAQFSSANGPRRAWRVMSYFTSARGGEGMASVVAALVNCSGAGDVPVGTGEPASPVFLLPDGLHSTFQQKV